MSQIEPANCMLRLAAEGTPLPCARADVLSGSPAVLFFKRAA
jgi:hypothetical protein